MPSPTPAAPQKRKEQISPGLTTRTGTAPPPRLALHLPVMIPACAACTACRTYYLHAAGILAGSHATPFNSLVSTSPSPSLGSLPRRRPPLHRYGCTFLSCFPPSLPSAAYAQVRLHAYTPTHTHTHLHRLQCMLLPPPPTWPKVCPSQSRPVSSSGRRDHIGALPVAVRVRAHCCAPPGTT